MRALYASRPRAPSRPPSADCNNTCSLKDITSVGLKLVKCSRPVLVAFSLSEKDVSTLSAELDDELASHAGLFHV